MSTQAEREAILDTIERAPAIIVPLLREIPEARRRQRPPSGKWSAHEHVCHLAEVHDCFFERLDVLTGEAPPVITPYVPSADEEAGAFLERDLDAELERFTRERRRLVERLRALEPAAWERTAIHPEYSHYSLHIFLRHVALHDHLHAYRIEEILLARDA